MVPVGYVALRGSHSFHILDRKTIKEVEVGAWRTRITTPYTVIEVDTRPNMDALNSICEEEVQEVVRSQENSANLYPRLSDLPF
jgi:hypothetical protein